MSRLNEVLKVLKLSKSDKNKYWEQYVKNGLAYVVGAFALESTVLIPYVYQTTQDLDNVYFKTAYLCFAIVAFIVIAYVAVRVDFLIFIYMSKRKTH